MTRRLLLIASLCLLVTGCLKRAEPNKAAEPTAVAAIFLLDQESETDVLPAPAALVDTATAMLAERNLVVRSIPPEEWAEDFSRRRSTRQRMLSLLDSSEEDVVLLVETRASLASLMEGRYTWTVPTQLTLARRGQADFPVQATVEAPVFLRFAHQGAPEAVEAAVTVITRRLARMTEDLLSEDLQSAAPARESGVKQAQASPRTHDDADAIYFVMVDRYKNGDPSNDRTVDPSDPQAFHGGDLRGLIDDLDRLAALGFRSVWVSPVWETRDERIGPWGAFHGYWVEDPGAVEPRFGTEAELVELSEALKERGMGLILDFVANHVAPGSPLVSENPEWFHGLGDIEDWDNAEEAVTHDVHGLPDLAQERPEVAQWLVDHAVQWQERLAPEGFRLDAVRHVAPAFWQSLNNELRAGDAGVALVGELFDGSPDAVSKSWSEGAFSGMFDFPLHYALTDVFCDDAPVGKLAATLARDRVYPDAAQLVTFLDNHDLPRIASRCGQDPLSGALTTLLALRGRPSITWGTELLLDGAEEPANRADFDWEAERRFEKQIALGLRMRADWSALRASTRQVLVLEESVFAWVQGDEDSAAVVAINLGEEPRTVELPPLGDWQDPAMRSDLEGAVTVAPGAVALATTRGEQPGMGVWLTDARAPESVELVVRLEGASLSKFDEMLLIGASTELGAWSPSKAVPAKRDGRDFVARVTVPRGDVLEFKFVIRQDGGSLLWEDRPNRYHLVVGGGEVTAGWEA